MKKNYAQLTQNVRSRLNPENTLLEKSFSNELASISYSDVLVYVRSAMKGVEPEYTRKSKEAGGHVMDHLKDVLTNVTFRYQGSVMTNTHIKGYSDIDLVVISEKFYTFDRTGVTVILENTEQREKFSRPSIKKLEIEKNGCLYTGNSLDDLHENRTSSENVLMKIYIDCDISMPKAIQITNRNLDRDVDIVTANWYDDVSSIINDKGENRGIQIYNKDRRRKEAADYPFLSISRINSRSSDTNGRLKKMVRFLKQCKVDSDHEILLSSFDINAVCYDIDQSKYQNLPFNELVQVLYQQLKRICEDDRYADKIISVDEREYIFYKNIEKKRNLALLRDELASIIVDLNDSNHH